MSATTWQQKKGDKGLLRSPAIRTVCFNFPGSPWPVRRAHSCPRSPTPLFVLLSLCLEKANCLKLTVNPQVVLAGNDQQVRPEAQVLVRALNSW